MNLNLTYLLTSITAILLSFVSCSSSSYDDSQSTPPDASEAQIIVSSYIRGNFYYDDRVMPDAMKACNDLICIGAQPTEDGKVSLDTYRRPLDGSKATFANLITDIKTDIRGTEITLRLGIHDDNDAWKTMVRSDVSRTAFAERVKSILQQYSLAGVDLDLEWAYSADLLADYSATIVTLRRVLGEEPIISVSLSPVSYKISPEAIGAATYISLQCYGPHPVYFDYDNYANAVNEVIAYGVPASKLVPGVPFYGVLADGDRAPVAYYNFVEDGLVTSPSQNSLMYNDETYVFNGQDMIARKTSFAINQGCYGIMCWDLADDAPYSDSLSLLRAIKSAVAN